jgi:hypothetical protein
VIISPSLPSTGTILNNHKINMKVKKNCQVLYYNPGADPGRAPAPGARPPKIGKNKIF